ncbi:MAG: aspartate/glutamate racemase family protein [Treponema sp.]|jgi:glutamate racemase|nr:aspartate/glutamate racemase family protein [Treponema sp.]
MQKMTGPPLAVLDWGIGGLPLFQSLCGALPGADLLYLSDSGSVPYGKQSSGALRRRLGDIAAFAAGFGTRAIAIACNALSSVLPAASSPAAGVEALSLIHSFLASPLPSGRVIGVIGGNRTIRSGIYQKALEAAGNRVRSRPTQALSALIEAGDMDAIPGFLEKTLAALGGIETLVLACTHYPAVSPVLQNIAPGLEIIDPGSALRNSCLERFSVPAGRRDAGGGRAYLTTGSAENSRRSAERAFGFAGLPFAHISTDLNPADMVPGGPA